MVTVELGSGRGLENGLSRNSVMERLDLEEYGLWLYIEIESLRLKTSSVISVIVDFIAPAGIIS